jgi:hypothetical protein
VVFECFDRIHGALFCSSFDGGFRHLFWREAGLSTNPWGVLTREYEYPHGITPFTT